MKKPHSNSTHFDGSKLVPDIDRVRADHGVVNEYYYWVGLTKTCPLETFDVAGINFSKRNERYISDPLGGPTMRAVPEEGSIVLLSEMKFRRLAERLPRAVIRVFGNRDPQALKEEPNTGVNVGDAYTRPQRGQLIIIPTREEVEARRKAGKPAQEYRPSPLDVPAARYMFAQLSEDQTKGSRGSTYETIEQTGLEWPAKLAELAALLG